MRLEDLKHSLLDMSEEELRDKIRGIRSDRIIRKTTKAQKAAKAKTRATASSKIDKLLQAMTPAERDAFLKELGGMEE